MSNIARFPTLIATYNNTLPGNSNQINLPAVQPHLAVLGSTIVNYNSQAAARNDRFPYLGVLAARNVYYQFYWTVNSQLLYLAKQSMFSEQIMLPYQLGAVVRMYNAQFTSLGEYAATLGVRLFAPSGALIQTTYTGCYWTES